jgi:hypothetical protein
MIRKKKVKRIIEREPGSGKKVVKGFGWFLIIGGIITMLVGIPTGVAMMTIEGSEIAGVVVMWIAFVPFWFGLLLRYLGRRPSQEVVIEEVIEEEEEENEEEGEGQDKNK